MIAVAQIDALIVPQRKLLECPRCGALIPGCFEQWCLANVKVFSPFLAFRCKCGHGLAMQLTPEWVPIFNLPR